MKPGASKSVLRWVFSLIALAALGGVIAVFINDYRQPVPESPTANNDAPDKANLVVEKIRQISRKDGKDEWLLEADAVRYINAENKALFDNLTVIFYLENGQNARLTAGQGVLKTDTKDIEVNHQVRVRQGIYTFETETLEYRYERKEFVSSTPVAFFSEQMRLTADTVTMDLNSNKLRFMGNVNGALSGELDIVNQWRF